MTGPPYLDPNQDLNTLSTFSSRLKHLHSIISKVPDRNFNLRSYGGYDENARCALGWATVDPTFNAMGFSGDYIPDYEGIRGIGAGESFFGLSSEEACSIFHEGHYPLGLEEGVRVECLRRIRKAYGQSAKAN